jgi:hypothetical protein
MIHLGFIPLSEFGSLNSHKIYIKKNIKSILLINFIL